MPCLVAILDCAHVHHVVHYTRIICMHIPCLVAIVAIADCPGSATISFKDLVAVAQVSTNQTADVLVEDQLQPLALRVEKQR